MYTPMGYVCEGRQLRADLPFFDTGGIKGAADGKPGLEFDKGGIVKFRNASVEDSDSNSDASLDINDEEEVGSNHSFNEEEMDVP